jgi:beta-1,2-mannobiose phosphorylase / 1,2-beta-oligomannan phosphorylase
MMTPELKKDHLIFSPSDVDLSFSPMKSTMRVGTCVLGAFNPGLCRLPNGNLLMMVRVAEALSEVKKNGKVHSIRWDRKNGYVTDEWALSEVTMVDPRKFLINSYNFPVYALTSLSWLLPVELNEDGSSVTRIHYDKIISPCDTSQEYGIEDPRISCIEGQYYMTACCVSSESHSTFLYVSKDGLNYTSMGMVLDHQNKDMLLFEGKVNGYFYALTRPLGECYFACSSESPYHPGAAIHLASSPDLLYWKPSDRPFLRTRKASLSNVKIGGGTPPIRTKDGWLILYHGVQSHETVGKYRTFWAIVNGEDPSKILHLDDTHALLESNPKLTSHISDQIYLHDIVFTTGIAEHDGDYILASGELDLACRITRISTDYFSNRT